MKVLHLLKTSTGAAWALRQMALLVEHGAEVHVALPPGGPNFDRYARAGIHVHEAPYLQSLVSSLKHSTLFRGLVKSVGPDIVHSHFVSSTLAARLVLGPDHATPRIFQVPGPLHLENLITRFVELSTQGSLDYWLASCRWTMDRYRRSGIDESRLGLVYYGLEWRDVRIQPTQLRDELGLSRDVPLIGMVAHIYPPKRYLGHARGIKGHEDFIDAVAMVRKRFPTVRGVIVGGPWAGAMNYAERLREYAVQRCSDGIIFLGHRDDIGGIYANLDLAVHPSHSENLGGALESMLAGVPTVATAVGGFPDLIEPDLTGWLAKPKNPADLANVIETALVCLNRHEIALHGQQRARNLCDLRTNVKDLLQFYTNILSRSAVH